MKTWCLKWGRNPEVLHFQALCLLAVGIRDVRRPSFIPSKSMVSKNITIVWYNSHLFFNSNKTRGCGLPRKSTMFGKQNNLIQFELASMAVFFLNGCVCVFHGCLIFDVWSKNDWKPLVETDQSLRLSILNE